MTAPNMCIFIFALFLSACTSMSTSRSELPNTFTSENIMKTHSGLNSDEIMKMYGSPKNVSQAVCGAKYGNPWSCITWEYGEFPNDRASFTFNGDGKKPILNSFDIIRRHSELPAEFNSENVIKIKQGMTSIEILAIFGTPSSVQQSVCGAATGNAWSCTTWEYCEFPNDRASFTFAHEHGSLLLNSFTVDKK